MVLGSVSYINLMATTKSGSMMGEAELIKSSVVQRVVGTCYVFIFPSFKKVEQAIIETF